MAHMYANGSELFCEPSSCRAMEPSSHCGQPLFSPGDLEKEFSLRGINVQEQWARRIYAGEKTVEARTWKPGSYADRLLWVIETPDKPRSNKRTHAEITGVIRFGNADAYASYKVWRDDFKRHCVPAGSTFEA